MRFCIRRNCAVRDACDLGYLVTLATDACATHSQDRHDNTLRAIKGYCRQRTADELVPGPGEEARERVAVLRGDDASLGVSMTETDEILRLDFVLTNNGSSPISVVGKIAPSFIA